MTEMKEHKGEISECSFDSWIYDGMRVELRFCHGVCPSCKKQGPVLSRRSALTVTLLHKCIQCGIFWEDTNELESNFEPFEEISAIDTCPFCNAVTYINGLAFSKGGKPEYFSCSKCGKEWPGEPSPNDEGPDSIIDIPF